MPQTWWEWALFVALLAFWIYLLSRRDVRAGIRAFPDVVSERLDEWAHNARRNTGKEPDQKLEARRLERFYSRGARAKRVD